MKYTLDNGVSSEHFNDFPDNFREITEKQFAQSTYFSYSFKRIEYRQMHDDERHIFAILFFTNPVDKPDIGFAIENDYWGGKLKYYAFGCEHKYRELSQKECAVRGIYHWGMHCHISLCEKCGDIWAVDSSG